MPALDKTRPASAQLFSRELEKCLQERPGNEKAQLWVVYVDYYGHALKMLIAEHPQFWKAGTIIHLEWSQWMCIQKDDALYWVNMFGETITHEKMLARASVVCPEDRRIISWLDN